MFPVEPHFYAAFKLGQACLEILDILPETDLLDELNELLLVQYDIFEHMIQKKHFGDRNLQRVIECTEEIKREMVRLKEEI